MELTDDISTLSGVGIRTAEALNKAGIFNLMDLILYFPRSYERVYELNEFNFSENEKLLIRARLTATTKPVRTKTGKSMVTLIFTSDIGDVKAIFFNMPYVANSLTVGNTYNLYGKFKIYGSSYNATNPKILKDEETPETGYEKGSMMDLNKSKVLAKYPLKENLTDKTLKKLIHQVMQQITIKENLPKEILSEYGYPTLDTAIRQIHEPDDSGSAFELSYERMKFQELFSYSLKIALAKDLRTSERNGIVFSMSKRLIEFKRSIPYELTSAQAMATRDILIDQKKDVPMNRLLQGDVGSGKTIVAFIALFNVIENGYQGVLMVPTEILARQHFNEAVKLFEQFGTKIRLLTGSTKASEKNSIKEELASGEPMLLIGTHAVIEDDVTLSNLGLIVTDEQHRFGVNQRMKLIKKQKNADVLVMSATPIPRTLALHMYSDLDLSVLDELPPGRQEIATYGFMKKSRLKAYEVALGEVINGRQVYVVCPMIEENEDIKLTSVGKLYTELKAGIFKDYNVEMIHGSLKNKEKQSIMERFVSGKIDVLVSTTVIEVGVNVPNASVMIIENSERFGLSQLHQLRGRVGRGIYKSYCLLITDSDSEIVRRRLSIITSTNDGFKIAEEDLKMRGSGAIFGTNQSGDSGLILSDFIQDYNLFTRASKWASIVYNSENPGYKKIRDEILNKIEKTVNYICLN